jgi:hypothetical protein
MGLTRKEILDYASRYVTPDEAADFPMDGELFCMLERELPPNKVLDDLEGWKFAGYGLCKGYRIDDDSRPAGKWIWFEYVSLAKFPPHATVSKLQPPHVVKGSWQNSERTREFKVMRIAVDDASMRDYADTMQGSVERGGRSAEKPAQPADGDLPGNVLRFPGPQDKGPGRTG